MYGTTIGATGKAAVSMLRRTCARPHGDLLQCRNESARTTLRRLLTKKGAVRFAQFRGRR